MINKRINSSFLDRFSGRNAKHTDMANYKKSVLRDIIFLFTSFSHLTEDDVVDEYDFVKNSVLLYGLNTFVGTESSVIKNNIEKQLKTSLTKYEPRVVSDSIEISIEEDKYNSVVYSISGELKVPYSDKNFNISLSIDLESGHTSLNKKSLGRL